MFTLPSKLTQTPARAAIFLLGLALAASQAFAQPTGYYDSVDTSDPSALRATLHDAIDDHTKIPYTSTDPDVWDIVNLAEEDPNDTGRIIDVYKNASYTKIPGGVGAYNREHAWPKSYGFPNDGDDNYPYTDGHHLFAADASYNGSRSNKPFRWCDASCDEWTTDLNDGRGGGSGVYPGNSNWTTGSFSTGTWETWDGRKGDVARAIFYMDIRYEGGTHGITGFAEPDLRLTDDDVIIDSYRTGSNEPVAYMGLYSVLLQWHQQDPVDAREIWRNEVVYSFQGNRNPFIDHPEYVDCLYLGTCGGGGGDVTPPSAPTGLAATAGDGAVMLDWDDNVEPDLAGYNVYRATSSGGPYSKINGPFLTSSLYTDSQATNGTTYYYVIAAVDTSSNLSADSNEASATPEGGGGPGDPPGGTGSLVLSEVLYDVSSTDDGFEWVEIFNSGSSSVDLAGWSLGNGGTDYTYSLVQLSGTIASGATFVIGGPSSSATNANPTFDQVLNFAPDFQNSGTTGDGVALFNVPAAQVNAATVPFDAVVYGPNNTNQLIDETGTANAPEVGDAGAGSSIERVDLAGAWQIQNSPTPNSTTLQASQNTPPTATITSPANGTQVTEGASVNFTGTGDDAEDGDLSANLDWQSDLDGSLGTGASINVVLSLGLHTITVTATDSGSLQGSDQITVEVIEAPTGGSGDLILSEVLYDVSGTDDGFEWVEIYNAGSTTVDLSGWSLGTGGVDYTTTTVQLSGNLAAGALFVVGGPTSDPLNGSPSFDQVANFDPDIQNSGTAGDGVALFNVPAASITPTTVPVDAVIYGPDNANGLLDESGSAPSGADVGDAPSGSSIERVDLTGAWQIQSSPTPNSSPLGGPPPNTAPTVTISLPSNGATFTEGEPVDFAAGAADAEDGDLTSAIAWNSDLDGALGSGGSFLSSTLSVGVHVLTASVTDSGGLGDSDQVSIEILAPSGPVTVTFASLGGEDGWLRESSENSSVGGSSQSGGKTSAQIRVGDDRRDRRYKAMLSFDTSSIPDGATITSVTLRLRRGEVKGTNPYGEFGQLQADIRTGSFGGDPALETSDFEASATSFNVVTLPNPAADGDWTEGDLDAAGVASVSHTGRTQLRLFFPLGDNDDRNEDYLAFYSGDDTDPANHPQLIVTYQ